MLVTAQKPSHGCRVTFDVHCNDFETDAVSITRRNGSFFCIGKVAARRNDALFYC